MSWTTRPSRFFGSSPTLYCLRVINSLISRVLGQKIWMVDSTTIIGHSVSQRSGQKGGSIEPSDHALGRSRGGLTTKIHLLCGHQGFPLAHSLSPGQHADSRYFKTLLEQVRLPGTPGRPRKRGRYIIADKGYDSDDLRRYCTRHGMRPIYSSPPDAPAPTLGTSPLVRPL